MPWKKFGLARHRPPDDWVQATGLIEVAGISFRKENVRAYCAAVEKAEKDHAAYGLLLEHQPNHPEDPNALAVFGVAPLSRWFRKPVISQWHIGYVPAEIAEEIVDEFLDKGLPISIELYSIFQQDDFFDIKFFILAPPGNSEATRRRKRNSE